MNIKETTALRVGAISCAIAIVAGAFGAHALKNILPAIMLEVFKTGVQYQLFQSLGILLVGILKLQGILSEKVHSFLVVLMTLSVLLFSGSLYILAISGIGILGIVTPFGGLGMIVSWVVLAFSVGRLQQR